MSGQKTGDYDHDYFLSLLPAGALNCLDPDEAEALARHLADCPPCVEELARYQALVGALAPVGALLPVAPEVALSPALRERLLAWVTEPADPTNDQQGNNE